MMLEDAPSSGRAAAPRGRRARLISALREGDRHLMYPRVEVDLVDADDRDAGVKAAASL